MSMGSDAYVDSLIDEMDAEFIIKERLKNKEWVTKAGVKLPISRMSRGHIINTVNWISNNMSDYGLEYIKLFQKELSHRDGGTGI